MERERLGDQGGEPLKSKPPGKGEGLGSAAMLGTMAAYREEEEELPQLKPKVGGWAAGGGHSVVSPAP